MNGTTCPYPKRKFGSVGMSSVFVDTADPSWNFDFLALDAHGLDAVLEETPKHTLGLETH